MKKKISGPNGVTVELDTEQVFKDDPGAGTPVIVLKDRYSATYDCAVGTGELVSSKGDYCNLTPIQIDWLVSKEEEINEFLGE